MYYDKEAARSAINQASRDVEDLKILDAYKATLNYYLVRVFDHIIEGKSGSLWDLENQVMQSIDCMDYDPKEGSPFRIMNKLFKELKSLRISD